MDRNTAIIESVRIRFRPIMMTALGQVAGMFPLATTVIGGIITGTLSDHGANPGGLFTIR